MPWRPTLGDAIGEVFLLVVAAHVDELEYGDGRLVRHRDVDSERGETSRSYVLVGMEPMALSGPQRS